MAATFDQDKFEEFLKRVHECNNVKIIKFIEEVGKDFTLECKNCKNLCFLYEFSQVKTGKHGMYFAICARCRRQLRDPFARLIHEMKKSTKTRN